MIEGVLKQTTQIHLSSGVVFTIPKGRRVWVEEEKGARVLKIESFPLSFIKLGGKFWVLGGEGEQVVFPEGGKAPFPFLLLSITRPK